MFDYRTAKRDQIQERGLALKGLSLEAVIERSPIKLNDKENNKGAVGQIIQRYFGIASDNRSGPDFEGAGIELKVVPVILRTGTSPRAKERMSISMIDYATLAKEDWPSASVRSKISEILLVFYHHDSARPRAQWKVMGVMLWRPLDDLDRAATIQRDWMTVRDKVTAGRSHELSESDSTLLAAATKGPGGGDRVIAPFTAPPQLARRRAWAFKQSVSTTLYRELRGGSNSFESLVRLTGLGRPVTIEELVEARLIALEGQMLSKIAKELEIKVGRGKSAAAMLVRRVLGAKGGKRPLRALEEQGYTVRTLPISPSGQAYEATSFPYFDPFELVEETWEDSALRSYLNHVLFVPLVRPARETPLLQATLGRAFIWTPTMEELSIIERGWEMYRALVADGHGDVLPASGNEIIHVRPHGKTSQDKVWAPNGRGGKMKVKKQSFWLNTSWTAELYARIAGLSAAR